MQAGRMLQVSSASFRHSPALLVGSKGLHAGAQEGLSTEIGSIRHLVGEEHRQVAVVDTMTLKPVSVLLRIDKLPMFG